MAQRKSILWTEIRVGLLVLTSFLLLILAVFFIGGESGVLADKYTVIAYFPAADGIKAGADVHFEGVAVGNVGCAGWFSWGCQPVRIVRGGGKSRSVEVELQIDRRYQNEILTDALITMDTVGLLGDKTIEIGRGDGTGQPIADKGTIQGQEVPGISQVVRGANDVIFNFNSMSQQFKEISDRIARGEGTLGQVLVNDSIYRNIDKTIKDTNRDVEKITTKITALIDDAHNGKGTLASLLRDDTLVTNLNGSITQLTQRVDRLIDRAERGDGSLPKLLNDPALYNNANRLVDNMNLTVNDARKMIETTQATVGNVNRAVDGMHTIVTNANRTLDTTQVAIKNADTAISDMRGMMAHVSEGKGLIGKLYTDDALYTDVRGSVTRFTQLMETIENGDGTAGKFIKDPSVYNGVKDTTAEIQKLIYDFRQDPKRFMTITFKLF